MDLDKKIAVLLYYLEFDLIDSRIKLQEIEVIMQKRNYTEKFYKSILHLISDKSGEFNIYD